MNIPEELRYTKDHEWIKVEGDIAVVGITEFAQKELGDIVFADLPTAGKVVTQGGSLCVVESTKAASDVYAPVSGKVETSNAALGKNPELINKKPYTDGWMVKLSGIKKEEVSKLMSAQQYRTMLGDKAA